MLILRQNTQHEACDSVHGTPHLSTNVTVPTEHHICRQMWQCPRNTTFVDKCDSAHGTPHLSTNVTVPTEHHICRQM